MKEEEGRGQKQGNDKKAQDVRRGGGKGRRERKESRRKRAEEMERGRRGGINKLLCLD